MQGLQTTFACYCLSVAFIIPWRNLATRQRAPPFPAPNHDPLPRPGIKRAGLARPEPSTLTAVDTTMTGYLSSV